MLVILKIIILISILKVSDGLLNKFEYIGSNNVNTKLKYIYDNFYEEKYTDGTIAFVLQNSFYGNENLIKYIHDDRKVKIVLFNMKQNCNVEYFEKDVRILLGHLNLIFIFLQNINFTESAILCLSRSAIWRPRSRFILIIEEPTNKITIEQTFKQIWKKKILNFIIVTKTNTANDDIFGFNPYYDNFYQHLTGRNTFYDKLTNLNGYKLSILMTRDEDVTKLIVEKQGNNTTYKGKDGNFVMSILTKCNAKYDVINLHHLLGNDNPWRPINKGLLEHEKELIIRQYNADFILDSQNIMINNFTEFLYPHSRDDAVFLVPKAKMLSQYQQLSRIFQKGFSYILIFFVVVVPLIWFAFKYLHMRLKKERVAKLNTMGSILLNNFRIALCSCINRLPNNSIEKILILFLLFCNLIITSYFQSILASILTVSTHEPQINTIKDLAESNLRPMGVPGVLAEVSEVLRVTGNEKLIPKLENLPPSLYFIHYRDFPKNACGVSNYDRMSMTVKIRPVLHVVQEHVVPTYLSFEVVEGSPYYDLFDKYILKILEAGLYDQWKNFYTFQWVLRIGIYDYDLEKGGYKDLILKQFSGVLWILLIGWIISGIVFIAEISIYKLKTRV